MDEYPEELKSSPIPVVAFLGSPGLAVEPHLPQLQRFIIRWVPPSDLPSRKEKRTSYENYVVKGILKANWMSKHKNFRPACVLIFTQLDDRWKNSEAEADLCSQIDTLRPQLRSRNIKLFVIMIHNTSILDSSDEKVVSFRRRADLDPRSLITGSARDLKGLAILVERIAYEGAVQHYKEEARRVKSLMRGLSRSTHAALLARLSFKTAFLAEFRMDTKQCIKYYQLSYSFIREARSVDERRADPTGLMESKIMSDFIDFKLVQLHMKSQAHMEAVQQFQRHMKLYKNCIGAVDIEFEHWAWIARQYQVFGELLVQNRGSESFSRGLLHPSHYYEAAAHYTMERRKHAQRLCEPLRNSPVVLDLRKDITVPNLADLSGLEYVGQTRFSSSKSSGIPGGDLINDEIYRRIAVELFMVDHASMALHLLTQAYRFYKITPHVGRAVIAIASQIAGLHSMMGDWERGRRFCERIRKKYAEEQWWELLIRILEIGVECARKLGLVEDVFKYSLELLSPHIGCPLEQRIVIQHDLEAILTGVDKDGLSLSSPLTLMLSDVSPLQIDAGFSDCMSSVKDSVNFSLRIISHFPAPLRFFSVEVMLNDSKFNHTFTDQHSASSAEDDVQSLLFQPGVGRTFSFSIVSNEITYLEAYLLHFPPSHVQESHTELQFFPICTVTCEQCTGIVLKWGRNVSSLLFHRCSDKPQSAKLTIGPFYPSLRIVERKALLFISTTHQPPALEGETYRLSFLLRNDHAEDIDEGLIVVAVPSTGGSDGQDSIVYMDSTGTTLFPESGIQVRRMRSGEWKTFTVFLFLSQLGDRTVTIKVKYNSAGMENVAVHLERLHVQAPFALRSYVFNEALVIPNPANPLRCARNFVFCQRLATTTPYPLRIASLTLSQEDQQRCLSDLSCTDCVDVAPGSGYTFCYHMKGGIEPEILQLQPLMLKWSRSESGAPEIVTVIPVSTIKIASCEFYGEVHIDPTGYVGIPMNYTVRVVNNTPRMQEFQLRMMEGSGFLLSGQLVGTITIPPCGWAECCNILLPIATGTQALPSVIVSPKPPSFIEEVPLEYITRNVFIRPSLGCSVHVC